MARRGCLTTLVILAVLGILIGALLWSESRNSPIQSHFLPGIASELTWTVEPGPSREIRFPATGPFDQRLGYTRIPEMTRSLEAHGFEVTAQARVSRRFREVVDRGFYPVYREKSAGGLILLDRRGEELFAARYPERTYPSLDAISPVVVRTLLFIENRNLLDPRFPRRNPVIDWRRLARSLVEYGARLLGSDRNIPGASTLATQVEKYRHSPDGITGGPREKVRQVATASLRIYLDGPETIPAQKRVILDYLNSVPVAAIPGHGEVNGLAQGLWAWFGLDHLETAALLRREGGPLLPGDLGSRPVSGDSMASSVAVPSAWDDPDTLAAAGRAYRAVLSLLLAHRRPTWYLTRDEGKGELRELTDAYLRRLGREGMISPELRDAALDALLEVHPRAPQPPPVSFVERKAASTVRSGLLTLMDVDQLYALDRFDMRVRTSIDRRTQAAVASRITDLADPAYLRRNGLVQDRLLGRGDPSKVIYSFILFEHTALGNVVRVQTDNYAQPLDLNTSGRLELGSTAKLRTLVTYLELIEGCHRRFSGLAPAAVDSLVGAAGDPLSRWTAEWLRQNPKATPLETLNAAMDRSYSASPAERFVTGGGVHSFSNFDKEHDGRVFPVREAFRHSVNLPFIRLMRDITRHYLFRDPEAKAQILQNPDDPRRAEYLARFADSEGTVFVQRFYAKLQGTVADSMAARVVGGLQPRLTREAWVFRAVFPATTLEDFETYLKRFPPRQSFTPGQARDAFRRADPSRVNLADQGYLARVHPLELWVARYLAEHPGASRSEVIAASATARQEVYRWLFNTRRRNAQDGRIRSLLEVEVFLKISENWKRLGYPFDNLTPSLATAIGSSGDRPVALAELVGILVNDGMRYPVARVEEVQMALDTPFETRLRRLPARGDRVLSSEVAQVARAALLDVVEAGTARRGMGTITTPDGQIVPMGGKTGTGDNRFLSTDARGRVIASRAVSRTSTFVFCFGERFFGVMTAYVRGRDADGYRFTSALPVQVVKLLGPELSRLEGVADAAESPAAGGMAPPPATPSTEGVVTGGTGTGGEEGESPDSTGKP